MAAPRTLTLFCTSGLCNRLRVLITGLVFAELSGRTFRLLWPRSHACGATFSELFVNTWPVDDADTLDAELEKNRVRRWPSAAGVDLLNDPRPAIVLGLNNWLMPVEGSWLGVSKRCAELLAMVAPVPPLAARIAEFRARHFRPTMIGVHLRRGDYLRHSPTQAANTARVLARVDRILAKRPDAGILLCTDDGAPDRGISRREGLRELFAARYGDRVVSAEPRSLDRHTVAAVQDGLVDLQLLRATHMVVGTAGSSFSRLAVFGRDVPHVLIGGMSGHQRLAAAPWRLIDRLRRWRRALAGPQRR